jgi:hypothetical protein
MKHDYQYERRAVNDERKWLKNPISGLGLFLGAPNNINHTGLAKHGKFSIFYLDLQFANTQAIMLNRGMVNMFRIGEFSKLTQVSIRMLRYYDETGLLKPAKIDEFTKYRLYLIEQIPVLKRVSFKLLILTLTTVRQFSI